MSSESPACLEFRAKVPSDWGVESLETVTDFQEGPGILANDFRESGVPLLRLRNIENPRVQLAGCNFLNPEKVNTKWKHFELRQGDFLISTSASLGRVSVVGPEAVGAIAYTGIIRFRSRSSRLHHEYLRAFLSSRSFVQQAERMATGSVIKHFGPSHLRQMAITLPPLETQVQIAQVFDALDDRISLLRETNTTLEAIAQALFKSWFVDFDPVHAKKQGRAPEGMDEATAALFPDNFEESELGSVPKGWQVERLGDVCSYLNRGISPKYLDEGGVLVVNQKCIRDFSVDYSKARRHDSAQRKIDGRQLEIGDMLVNSTGVGTLGRVAQVLSLDEVTIVDSHVTVVRPGEKLSWPFLGQWMIRQQPNIEAMGEGSTGQTELARSKLAKLPILVPAVDALKAFDAIVKSLKERIAVNETSVSELAKLRDTLLPRLISGQLQMQTPKQSLQEAER